MADARLRMRRMVFPNKYSTPNRIKSQNKSVLERTMTQTDDMKIEQSQPSLNPSEFNYIDTSFSPSSYREAIDLVNSSPKKVNRYGSIKSEATSIGFVKNHKNNTQNEQPNHGAEKNKGASGNETTKAASNFWNQRSPASTENLLNAAENPTVLPAIVTKEVKKRQLDTIELNNTKESAPQTPSLSISKFQLPPPPKDSSGSSSKPSGLSMPSLGKLGPGKLTLPSLNKK